MHLQKVIDLPNKILFAFILFAFIVNINAQSIDLSEDFLDSLDPSMREELKSSSDRKEEQAMEKLFNSDSSLDKNKAILEKLKKQLNELDIRLNEGNQQDNEALEVFGRKFFSSLQSTFMPINIPNFSSNYVIDVGDEFILMLTGKINKEHVLEVQRDGSLVIPSFGKVNVAGSSIDSANTALGSLIENSMLGVSHHFALSKIRDIQVLLLGGVDSPGVYTLAGGSNLLHALNVSGGIAENGSFRKVDLIRDAQVIGSYDLYDIFVNGSFDLNTTLKAGDSIFVHPQSFQIPLTGGVNNAAIFEILQGETLEDLIFFAGGFSPGFDGFNTILVNTVGLDKAFMQEINIKDLASFEIKSRDSVMVPSYENKGLELFSVNIEGLVKRPGKYFFQEGETLSNLIKRSGGYKDGAYIFGAALFRERARKLEQTFSQRNYSDVLSYITSNIGKPGVQLNSTAIELLTEEAKSKEVVGRIITDFNLSILDQSPAKDLLLESGDHIVIPPLDKTVYLFGDFSNPSNVTYSSSRTVKDYIASVGGLKDTSLSTIYIIDPDGVTHLYSVNRFFDRERIAIYPGTIIYASKDAGKLQGIEFASVFAPILSALALSLASLNSISN